MVMMMMGQEGEIFKLDGRLISDWRWAARK